MQLYSEMEPLYKELHAYVRRKLYNVYGAVSRLNPVHASDMNQLVRKSYVR